jgi:linoleoyl-CoA desaturase
MNATQRTAPATPPRRGGTSDRKLTFARGNEFQTDLRRRVDEYFQSSGRRQRDCPQMYVKTAILLASLAALYGLLVFVAQAWWSALPLAALLGLVIACIGFNVQHDGGHGAYSDHRWVNKLMALTFDLIGGSSYYWHHKHGVFHHTYTNVTGLDKDVDLGLLARLTPQQKRLPFHRWQHYYLWPLYGLMAIKWNLFNDFRDVVTGRMDGHPVARPRGWDLVSFLAGKAVFFSLTFGIPLLLHPAWVVLLFYGVMALVAGIVLSVVFQLAHCVEEADFPQPHNDAGCIDKPWAVHQVETTVDFARDSRVASWLLGGLNFQIEHHLFPRICHVNYPAISKIVEQTCRDHGVKYAVHLSFWAGLAAHYRWLRRLGRPPAEERAALG